MSCDRKRRAGCRCLRVGSKITLLTVLAACIGATAALPPAASAVTVAPAPTPGVANGAEGRTDELVSPAIKDGAEAGYSETMATLSGKEQPAYAVATANGEAILYTVGYALGATPTSLEPYAVSRWSAATRSWTTSALLPPPAERVTVFESFPGYFYPSADLGSAAFASTPAFAASPDQADSPNVYLTTGGGPATWLGRPSIENPAPALGSFSDQINLAIDGASPNLKTVYFQYPGTLLEGDPVGVTNLYEWHEGALTNVGRLPDGSINAAGASGAAAPLNGPSMFALTPEAYANQVAANGSRLFFVAFPSRNLYMHVQGQARSVLVSRDDCIAVEGACTATKATEGAPAPKAPESFYASPDGEHVFFADRSRLTPSAPETAIPKMYEFNVASGELVYVEGIATGEAFKSTRTKILGMANNGETVLYLESIKSPWALRVWHRTAAGGEESHEIGTFVSKLGAKPPQFKSVRATTDGSVFVFVEQNPLTPTEAEPSGKTFNNAGYYDQVYRYSVTHNELDCLSCAPAGVTPHGNAALGNDDWKRNINGIENEDSGRIVHNRGMTANGEAVFFQTPEALVPQDVNGVEDVYEWKDNHVYLISSGHSPQPSFVLDNGQAGNNVFFATTQGLSPEDREGGYDVYDARIGAPPRLVGGAEACPSHCQQVAPPPGTPSLTSGATGPSGNLTPLAPVKTSSKTHGKHGKNVSSARRRALRQCRKHARRRKNARKRKRALRRCGRRYGHAARRHGRHHRRRRKAGHHHNRRTGARRRG